jgi:acyl-CoA reductase-like NAD-dependent aldehyde dehydrogenase
MRHGRSHGRQHHAWTCRRRASAQEDPGLHPYGGEEGAKIVVGGGRAAGQSRGWFVEPTVLANVDNAMRVAREEIFGPVVCVIPYDSEDEAVEIASDSEYGLGGAVYSSDPRRALDLARLIDSGYISVNRYGITSSAPFGGVKRSGIGRGAYDRGIRLAPRVRTSFAKPRLRRRTLGDYS